MFLPFGSVTVIPDKESIKGGKVYSGSWDTVHPVRESKEVRVARGCHGGSMREAAEKGSGSQLSSSFIQLRPPSHGMMWTYSKAGPSFPL